MLQKADANLLIANACRLWRNSDDATLDPIKEALQTTPFLLYLNNADRDVVESLQVSYRLKCQFIHSLVAWHN